MPDKTTIHPSALRNPFASVEEIIADIRAGKMVVMVDDENRENEGDLIMAAEKVRPEDINFMATHGRGLVCLTLSRERCKQLRLPLMVRETDQHHATNFTISIEAAEGITTGISAHDRARTIQAAVAPGAKPEHLSQPGHIFPVMAQPGGVLTRAGHTEAGCDLARLAGLEPATAIVEILKEDGSMARRPDLEVFAKQHGIKIGTIADLIRYRLDTERNVERIAEKPVMTEHGEFNLYCYDDHVNRAVHVALVKGDLATIESPLVRVHLQDTLGDVIGVESPSLGWPLSSAIERIAEEGVGVIVLLRDQETSRNFMDAVESLGSPHDELEERRSGDEVLRTYGVGAQILRDLGLSKIRVLSAPKHMYAISGFDLEITGYVSE
ncbi:MAG TPA: bifunctional 3,4-dihydroxy-2-butanone-4-phosphate synthase/GTP cyclohydrolase II [Woeseiaceae bacterium]|nr:bifunctional 3,4-dihydroxy-2-butanone-4-phosphate synthase/GTP cyclohydrolase II [Woeseiaceae bacterium]